MKIQSLSLLGGVNKKKKRKFYGCEIIKELLLLCILLYENILFMKNKISNSVEIEEQIVVGSDFFKNRLHFVLIINFFSK